MSAENINVASISSEGALPGLRIYYVPPRLAGPLESWSGKTGPDGRSWLLDHACELGFNALWFSPMHETTQIVKIKDGKAQTGSLYAARHHFALDPEFSTAPGHVDRENYSLQDLAQIDEKDRAHLRHFTAQARQQGIKVLADLVFNHVAADHPLVVEETQKIQKLLRQAETSGHTVTRIYEHYGNMVLDHEGHSGGILVGVDIGGEKNFFKFRRDYDFGVTVAGPKDDPWSDVAHVNYESPEARRFFITGDTNEPAYWNKVMDWYMDLGFTGFRCDVAYLLPPDCWQSLISHARNRVPEALFLAETLGDAPDKVEQMAQARCEISRGERPAFDLGMIGNHWWNFLKDWLFKDEIPRLFRMALFGGAAAPDNHDTQDTVAGFATKKFFDPCKYPDFDEHRRREIISDVCARNYAVSAFIGNSVIMQMGYEYCNERQNHVFRDSTEPDWWKRLLEERSHPDHPLNLSERIKKINQLKKDMGVENCNVLIKDCSRSMANPDLVKIQCEYIDVDTREKKAEVVLLVNKKPQYGPIAVTEAAMESSEHEHLDRLVLGEGDITERTVVHEVMILHTPVKASAPDVGVVRAPRPSL